MQCSTSIRFTGIAHLLAGFSPLGCPGMTELKFLRHVRSAPATRAQGNRASPQTQQLPEATRNERMRSYGPWWTRSMRRSSTGSGGNIPGTAPSARLGIGGQTGSILRAEGQQDVSRPDDRARPRLAAYPARRPNCRCCLDPSGCCLMPRATG
jgi:hypothetical protein